MKQKEFSPSKTVAIKAVNAAFEILKDEGGELPGREVIEKIRNKVEFTDWEKEVYKRTGYVRWESILHFYTVDCAKAGYMRKAKGIWYLTPEGEQAVKKCAVSLFETAAQAYREWDARGKMKLMNQH